MCLSLESSELYIDLAFTRIPKVDIVVNEDYSKTLLLNDSRFWSDRLVVWLKYIRNNLDCFCPELVRKINSFSLGLQFTDDLTIIELNQS